MISYPSESEEDAIVTHYRRRTHYFFFQDFISNYRFGEIHFECVGPISESIVVYMVLASIKDALQT